MGLAHVRTLIVTAALLIAAGVASAHEIGTTRVDAHLANGRFTIDVTTAPRALVEKLEHRRVPASTSARELQQRLETNRARFAENCEIRFGATRVTPDVNLLTIVSDAQGPSSVTVRLTGAIPPAGGAFTWRYHLTYAAYTLSIGDDVQWLDADATSEPYMRRRDVVRQYLVLGFTHIVPGGLDHILFVLGIFLLSTKLKPVLAQVTAFTLAHSITLGLTIYGVLHVSPKIVEPLIALSIVYVAVENLMTTELKPWRVAIVFAFGLLHGMGFAGVLRELGLPRARFVTALVTFNIGVELGQLSVIATAFLLVAYWHRTKPWYRHRFVVPASVAIAATGLFWTLQRIS